MVNREARERALFHRNEHLTLRAKLAQGSTGSIYEVQDVRNPDSSRILKLQVDELDELLLDQEAMAYERLRAACPMPIRGIPEYFESDINDVYHCILMERLGPSVFELLRHRHFQRREAENSRNAGSDGESTLGSEDGTSEEDDAQMIDEEDTDDDDDEEYEPNSEVDFDVPESNSMDTDTEIEDEEVADIRVDGSDLLEGIERGSIGDSSSESQQEAEAPTLNLKTVFMTAVRLMDIIKANHKRGVYHLNIKDQNVLTARNMQEDYQKIYLVGFKFCYVIDERGRHIFKNSLHIPESQYEESMGRAEREMVRRKDLRNTDFACLLVTLMNMYSPERSGAMFLDPVYFQTKDDMDMQQIEEIFESYPVEFMQMFLYYTSLNSANPPNYHLMREIFQGGLHSRGLQNDGDFDWSFSA